MEIKTSLNKLNRHLKVRYFFAGILLSAVGCDVNNNDAYADSGRRKVNNIDISYYKANVYIDPYNNCQYLVMTVFGNGITMAKRMNADGTQMGCT